MTNGLNLGNVLQTAESIRGQRIQNQLGQQTFETNVLARQGSNQFNALLQQHFANPTPETFNAIAAASPETAQQIQTVQTGQQEQEQRNAQIAVSGATNLINSANPKRFLEIALPELADQLTQNGVDIDALTNEQVVSIGNEIIAKRSPVANLGQDPLAAVSVPGKIQQDIRAGFLTEEQAAEAGEPETFSNVTQNPDGSSTGISSKTSKLTIIPRAEGGETPTPQTKAQLDAINGLVDRAKKDKRVNDFITVSSSFDRVKSASANAAGDLALVFSFMKMLDPGSVVREGEQALARNAAGVPEITRTLYNRLLEGESLSANQRVRFKSEAGKVLKASEERARIAVAPIMGQAERFNLRAETIEEAVFGFPQEEVQEAPGRRVIQDGNIFELQPDGTMLFIGKQ